MHVGLSNSRGRKSAIQPWYVYIYIHTYVCNFPHFSIGPSATFVAWKFQSCQEVKGITWLSVLWLRFLEGSTFLLSMHHTARLKREAGTGVRDPLDEKYPFYAAWPTHTAECWGWPGIVCSHIELHFVGLRVVQLTKTWNVSHLIIRISWDSWVCDIYRPDNMSFITKRCLTVTVCLVDISSCHCTISSCFWYHSFWIVLLSLSHIATNPKVLVETSGSDGEHDQEKLHRFLEARIPRSEFVRSGDETYWRTGRLVYAWGMGNDNLSVELFRGDLQYMIYTYIDICIRD